MELNKDYWQKGRISRKKILLMLLPFWDPQVPPVGISCLKSSIQKEGYQVKTVDANVEAEFRKVPFNYFEIIKKYVPENKVRHIYNIGYEVLRNHAMAHMNYENESEYTELVKKLVYHTFYFELDDGQISQLNKVMKDFFHKLEEYLINILDIEKPGVLGLSVFSGTFPASLFAFKFAKTIYPDIMNVMGGGIFSGELTIDSPNFKSFLEKVSYIDKIIVGEGELLFQELLRGKLPESQKVFTAQDIDRKVLDILSADIPDFSDFDLQYYTQMANYTSRSCPFQCNFCVETIYWGKYRKKSAQQLVWELSELFEKYNHQLFFMCDSLLNPIIGPLSSEFINSGISLYWGGYLRIDENVCNSEKTLLWRRGGFYRARLGVESGSQRLLNLMNKKITVDQIRKGVSSLASVGIKTTTYWVIGYPGESEEDFQQTLDLIEELRDDIYEADCNPFFYFLTGQINSNEWIKEKKSIPLYPKNSQEMLMIQTWILDTEPSREDTYKRVQRFVEHCRKLGIPNPYTLNEIYKADERWLKLHRNAVPPLIGFQNKTQYINECKNVNELFMIQDTLSDGRDFGF